MVLEMLKLFTPAELQDRVSALPDAARDYLAAESKYLSLCASYVARQFSLVAIAALIFVAILFSLFNALLVFIFYMLSVSSFHFSAMQIVAIEAGVVLMLCLGVLLMLHSAVKRMKTTFGQYIRHWES